MGGDGRTIQSRFRPKDDAPERLVVAEVQTIVGFKRKGFRFGKAMEFESFGNPDFLAILDESRISQARNVGPPFARQKSFPGFTANRNILPAQKLAQILRACPSILFWF